MKNIEVRSKGSVQDPGVPVLAEEGAFSRLLYCEQRRTVVSGRRSALAIVDCSALATGNRNGIETIASQLSAAVRATDRIGWYRQGAEIGILFAELGDSVDDAARAALLAKTERAVRKHLSPELAARILVSVRMLPGDQQTVEPVAPVREFPAPERPSRLELLGEEAFLKALHTEQRRTERSERRFVLAVIDVENLLKAQCPETRQSLVEALANSVRLTDTAGWYRHGRSLGIIFTEVGDDNGRSVAAALFSKFGAALASVLTIEQISHISLSFHVFPHDWDTDGHCALSKEVVYAEESTGRKIALAVKRGMDIVGSAGGLLVLSPVFGAIAAAVKLSSPGPVFFRQERVGQFGKRFTFYKFRSMKNGNNQAIHEQFVAKLIEEGDQARQDGQYKIQKDPRVTRIGEFLRKTSLDELPQLFNVLKGEMSLVGPRPPIAYEVKRYDLWHRRRLLAAKPGMTGLWQVAGRSRVAFNDMVRLDLKYATQWSLALDLKILLQTPRAVLGGEGAR